MEIKEELERLPRCFSTSQVSDPRLVDLIVGYIGLTRYMREGKTIECLEWLQGIYLFYQNSFGSTFTCNPDTTFRSMENQLHNLLRDVLDLVYIPEHAIFVQVKPPEVIF